MTPRKRQMELIVDQDIINVAKIAGDDYICLTDIAKGGGQERALHSWLRSKGTIEFLGFWEQMHNKDFKLHDFVYFKNRTGDSNFNPSISEWIEATNAKGLVTKRGRYGGTYAHADIAFEFATWISPTFKLLLIKEFQQLKGKEEELRIWDGRRYLSKVNYRLHTAAVKETLTKNSYIPSSKQGFVYASEADMLNVIVFGETAAAWKEKNKASASAGGNQRDGATISQLVTLANLESLNSMYLAAGKTQRERSTLLFEEAQRQRKVLSETEKIEIEAVDKESPLGLDY